MLRPAVLTQLLWLGLVGSSATVAYAALTWIGATLFGLPAAVASTSSYALAALGSYFGHRRLIFRSDRPHGESVLPFVAVSIAGYTTAFVIPGLASGLLHAPIELSIALTCIVNYLALSRFVFRAQH